MKKQITSHHTTRQSIDASHLKDEAFNYTIAHLKEEAGKQGVKIEDQDIIIALGISESQFHLYKEKDTAPEHVFVQLRSIYKGYIKKIVNKVQFEIEIEAPDDPPYPSSEEEVDE